MALILGQSAMSESATAHCFYLVRVLSSLHLEVWDSPLIKVFIVWKDIGRYCVSKLIAFNATVTRNPLCEISLPDFIESVSMVSLGFGPILLRNPG
ncbi:unnamed protein product [Rodentolepis nana]|uniref:Secreted protein n=1 Tax=Rodentolepis nana TaxID=102285 RepID=A0A0R3T8E6_RODNA|nr:unnamed protein product [Rodentolepis nana]